METTCEREGRGQTETQHFVPPHTLGDNIITVLEHVKLVPVGVN